jgi:hypothetical protein
MLIGPCRNCTSAPSQVPGELQCGTAPTGIGILTKWEWVKLYLTALAISIALYAAGGVVWLAVERLSALSQIVDPL